MVRKPFLQTTFVRLAEFLETDPNELIVEVEEDAIKKYEEE